MDKTNSHLKEKTYQLLGFYQTNSPIFCSEEAIRRSMNEVYAEAFFKFVLELQKMLGLDAVFNQPQEQNRQREKIKDLFIACFSCYPQHDLEGMFHYLLVDLIGGRNGAYNFAYGLKLYLLFKEDAYLESFFEKIFKSRIESNILSRYYENNPQKSSMTAEEIIKFFEQPLQKKFSMYFNKETSL